MRLNLLARSAPSTRNRPRTIGRQAFVGLVARAARDVRQL
jgi:hypothetical protein